LISISINFSLIDELAAPALPAGGAPAGSAPRTATVMRGPHHARPLSYPGPPIKEKLIEMEIKPGELLLDRRTRYRPEP